MWSIYENRKIDNKPKTREQKIVGGASSIMMYVWNFGMWSIYENPKLDNNPNTWKQTQKSEIKNRAVSVEHRGVCVCGMLQCDQSMKTQDLTTNPKLENEKSWGERRVSWCVCVWNVAMWSIYENPKLDNKPTWTLLVFYSLVHEGSWGERQTSFCVCTGINR